MEGKKLLSTEEIAKIYDVSPYTVTQTWVRRGLKHVRGKRKEFLYKTEWVDTYLEEEAEKNIILNCNNNNLKIKGTLRKCNAKVY